jgi:hypothetical protein
MSDFGIAHERYWGEGRAATWRARRIRLGTIS